ncbi:MAG: glycosyltransferase [Clostridiales bacterium]|nr:glycosyltransferase [Clostridiales bacterium]
MAEYFRSFLNCVGYFFILYLIGYATFLFLSVVIGSIDLYQSGQMERMRNTLWQSYYIPVSILVPAYNEEVTVADTVRSLLELDYKLFEIIIMDDGSKDNTSGVLIEAFNMVRVNRPIRHIIPCRPAEAVYEATGTRVPVTLIRKKNGGKADSLNMGINCSKYPYFVCMDADSILQHDSLERIVRPVLEDENVVAVGGTVRPANGVLIKDGHVIKYRIPKNILAAMQTLEYDRSFLAARILFDRFNGNLIISGAFGLFKKNTVVAVGGYDRGTMGEDMELVVKLHEYCRANRHPYRIRFASDAVCWSQVPERLKDLGKQRKRWHLGLFQCIWGHRRILCNPEFGAVGTISYVYFTVYELLSPFIEIFGMLTIILSIAIDMLNLPFMIMFFTAYVLYGIVLSLTAFFARMYTIDITLRAVDVARAFVLCLFEVVFLRNYLAFKRMTAFFGYKKNKLNWGKLERKKLNQEE